jgi:flagellar FliJ protein
MSELKSVQLAIELATRDRDELAKVVARVERNLAFVNDQMAQLEGYAAEKDANWMASGARSVSPEVMRHHYQFMERLQHAMSLQTHTIANTGQQLELAKGNLLRAEFRLNGLNQVLKSRMAALMRTEQRREQRQTDEFAALQHARNRAESMNGEKHDY